MTIRVPLISPVDAIVYRLDLAATWAEDPPGDLSAGYDYILREPVVSRNASGTRHVERSEMAPVTIPCQKEVATFEQLHTTFSGNDPVTDIILVFHRRDLESLGLLDANKKCVLKPGDRIDHLEKSGRVIETYAEPLYIYQVKPGSWGFGPDGYDLELAYTTYRADSPT